MDPLNNQMHCHTEREELVEQALVAWGKSSSYSSRIVVAIDVSMSNTRENEYMGNISLGLRRSVALNDIVG